MNDMELQQKIQSVHDFLAKTTNWVHTRTSDYGGTSSRYYEITLSFLKTDFIEGVMCCVPLNSAEEAASILAGIPLKHPARDIKKEFIGLVGSDTSEESVYMQIMVNQNQV